MPSGRADRAARTPEAPLPARRINTATELAMMEMRKRHPELSDEAIEALGWHFSCCNF